MSFGMWHYIGSINLYCSTPYCYHGLDFWECRDPECRNGMQKPFTPNLPKNSVHMREVVFKAYFLIWKKGSTKLQRLIILHLSLFFQRSFKRYLWNKMLWLGLHLFQFSLNNNMFNIIRATTRCSYWRKKHFNLNDEENWSILTRM